MSSPFAQRTLNRQDYKTLSLSALGATLELYDFVIFIFLLSELSSLFFPPDMPLWLKQLQGIGIFAAGFVVRPISGVIIAHFGDKLGRKRMFTLSIFLMAIPTLCIGLLPTYASIGIAAPILLLLMRMMQGAAIGGEVPGAWVFVAEHITKRHMGLGLGIVTCGISAGSLLGAFIVLAINKNFSAEQLHDFAWRIPFIIGGIFGFIAVYLRRYLSETPVFKEIAAKRKLSKKFPISVVLKEHWQACTISAAMTWTTSAVVFVLILLPPTLLPEKYGLSKALVLKANTLGTIMMVLGNISLGWLHDRFGVRTCYLFGWLGVLVSSFLFFSNLHQVSEAQLIIYYMFAGYFAGTTVTMPTISIPAFPAAVRYTGVSFAYNSTFALGGIITPILISLWFRVDALAPFYYLAIASVLSIWVAFTHLAQHGYSSQNFSEAQNKTSGSFLR